MPSVRLSYPWVLAITLGLTGLTIGVALWRSVRYLRPLSAWITSDREDSALTERAWATAVGMPVELTWIPRRGIHVPAFQPAGPQA